jgi:hypothetical protein
LTEGSSTSSRQALYALGYTGARIDVCDPKPFFCLARFSRFTHAIYRCPPFHSEPENYVDFVLKKVRSRRYDVLFPVHDQVFLLSRYRERFQKHVGLPVPEFSAIEKLQGKAHFLRVLDELGLPHPETAFVRTTPELMAACKPPCFVKLPYSTAGCGVWRILTPLDQDRVVTLLEKGGWLNGRTEILVQQPAADTLGVVQSIFQNGRLAAAHCYQARALGLGGSARAREGVSHEIVFEHLRVLGRRLDWHGALSLDYIWDKTKNQPAYIDANPRIGESFNATASGVNLGALLLGVALDEPLPEFQSGRTGLRTHSLLTTLLDLAERTRSRGDLVRETARAFFHKGLYAGSQDEITRPGEDPASIVPLLAVLGRTLASPASAARWVQSVVENYALSEETVRRLE